MFQWVEFITTAALGTNGVLPAADGANYYIGAYPATDGVLINPIIAQESDTTWSAWTPTVNRRITDPSVDVPGSIGKATYFTGSPGVFSDTTMTKTDANLLIGAVNNKINENNQFNSKANAYNTAKDAYNKAVTEENARLKDIFKAAFDPKVVIPTRPDPPSPPAAFQGPFL